VNIIEDGMILTDGNLITEVGKDLKIGDREIIEFPNHVVIPGLINTHSHVAMTLFRGYADDIPLNSWLNDYIWPMEAKLKPDHVENAAKLSAVELIMSGTTAVNSMYWYPDSELKAFSEIGVRMMAGPPIISGVSDFKSSEYLIEKWHGKNDDMTRITINPHAPYTVTAEDFQGIHEYKTRYNKQKQRSRLKIHTHLAESKIEMDLIDNFMKDKGFEISHKFSSPIQYLDSLNLLNHDLIAAHVVECTTEDLELLRKNNVGIALSIMSNLKLGNGIAKINEMESLGLKLGIGTDGPASNNGFDMFETMRMSTLIHKGLENDPTVLPAEKLIIMGTKGGANVLGWEGIGSIHPNNKADLVFLDLNKPHLRPIINNRSIISMLIYSANQQDVSDVMINGIWKLRNNKLIDIDLETILEKFEKSVADLFEN
jgi:5-methylthioadenosine/S-adenosylhomocysteine deaminase